MTLVRFKNSELLRDSMIPKFFNNSFFNEFFPEATSDSRFFSPKVDIVEKENQFEVHASLPGMTKEDIKIDLKNELLTISGERKFQNEQKEAKYHLVESHYGSFSRSFTLPETVNKEQIQAEFTNGILTLVLPKSEPKDNSIKIAIK
ncbi:MAG: Hsp20/alpha crystallin family protein [Bacteroidia bacterium]|nr:Hsp20/alpha crystallin family protein [Bacteroidia bacterium]